MNVHIIGTKQICVELVGLNSESWYVRHMGDSTCSYGSTPSSHRLDN